MDWSVLSSLLSSVDPTAVSIGLLLVGLGLVWTYVYFGGRQQGVAVIEPPPATGVKKGGKGKTKSKQVEDSPKPVRQPESSPSSKASKKQTQKVGGVSQVDPAPSPRKSGGRKSKKAKVNTAVPADMAQPAEEDNDGEWQTQLSRHKLRALRKQQQEQEQEGTKGKRDSPEGRDDRRGGKAGPTKLEEGHTLSPVPGEGLGSVGEPGGSSPEPPTTSSAVTDMERALKDAARSSTSSPDEDGVGSSEPPPQEERRKNVTAEGSQSSESSEREEWVVL